MGSSNRMYDLKYKITVVVEDLTKGEFVEFSQVISKNGIVLNNVPTEIDKKDVTHYVQEQIREYCINNNITLEDLFIDGYEVTHDNERVDIYFSVEDMENFSLEPSVMAVISYSNVRPILEGEQINDNTIKWTWSWEGRGEFVSKLRDFETGRKLAHTPPGINYFIESGLKEGQVVTRQVTTACDHAEELSIPISMNVINNVKSSVFRRFEAPKRNEEYKLQNMSVASRLKAFQSGVGDDEDCMIFKPDDLKYAKKFKLINKIYGVRASSTIKYNTVKFLYRFMLKGKVNYMGYGGSFKVKARRIDIPDISEEPTDVTYGDWIESRPYAEYHFNDEAFVAEIPMYDLFDGMDTQYKGNRMKFEITLYDICGRMEVYNQTLGRNQIVDVEGESLTFELKGFYDTIFRVKSLPIMKVKDYVEVYPPEHFEPLVGAVNGDFEMTENGKKDMVAWCNKFDVPDIVYDKKYYCLIEHDKTNPSVADVQFKFDNQVEGEDYTLVESDRVVFKCDTIIEDETEYREYLTQIDRGYYAIADNRKHSYRYKLDLNNLNPKRYKRFEIDVTTNVNDIVVLSSEVEFDFPEEGKITTELYTQVRALQSAIAKWNPYIHSGYYYYNQEERFLYNRSNINGLNVKMEQFAYIGDISVNVLFHVKGGDGVLERYNFELITEEDLDTSPSKFEYIGGMLWPKPTVITDGFPNYEPQYTYFTKPFVCPKEPTSILSIDWKEITREFTSVEVYAVTYNDVYGEWREPVLLTKGQPVPKEVIPSKVMMLKVIAKPSLRPQIRRREYTYSCDADWLEWRDEKLSYNIYHKEEVLQQRSPKTEGYLVSKYHDLGDTVEEEKLRRISYISTAGENIKVYYQDADNFSDISNCYNATEWIFMDPGRMYATNRYVRFKVKVEDEARLKFLKTVIWRYEYTDMPKEDYLPAFGDMRISQEYNPEDVIKLVEYTTSMGLPFDKHTHTLIDNVKLLGNNLGTDQDFSASDIVQVDFNPVGMYSDEYNLIYERTENEPILVDKPLLVQSKEFVEDQELKENSQAGVLVSPEDGKRLKLSPIPQQFSPIIIHEERDNETVIIPYQQVYFINENGQYSLNNIEMFESLGFKTLYLQEYNIDHSTVIVRINGGLVESFKIESNIITFDEEVSRGSEIIISYRVKNSFIAMYDYENDSVNIELHGDSVYDRVDSVRVHYETNKETLLKKLDHISLNPIYNPVYNGYIYISDKVNKPFKVTILPADNMVYANGLDTMNVLVKVEDKDQNPVSGVNVNLACAMGKLDKERSITDINGIASYTYTSWTGDCIDKLKASVAENVYGESEIINRRVIRKVKNIKSIKGE